MEVVICKICGEPLYKIDEMDNFKIGHALSHAVEAITRIAKTHYSKKHKDKPTNNAL